MNERTKKLYEQATTWALDNYPPPVNTFMWEDLRNEKFAELIVRECLDVVKSNIYGPTGEHDYSYTDVNYKADKRAESIYEDIQYRFGVKE